MTNNNGNTPRLAKHKSRVSYLPVLLLAAAFIAVLLFSFRENLTHYFFPLHHREQVEAIAAEYGLDPWLVFAVIRAESSFKVYAESHAGARGLMQLMPSTAAWIIETAGFEMEEEEIWQPEANIRLGCWYIGWLRNYYDDDMAAVLAAYNAGISNVNTWLNNGVWDGTLENLDDIPFAETRRYLSYVYESHDMYGFLYGE